MSTAILIAHYLNSQQTRSHNLRSSVKTNSLRGEKINPKLSNKQVPVSQKRHLKHLERHERGMCDSTPPSSREKKCCATQWDPGHSCRMERRALKRHLRVDNGSLDLQELRENRRASRCLEEARTTRDGRTEPITGGLRPGWVSLIPKIKAKCWKVS